MRHCEQRDNRNKRRQSTEFIIDDVLEEAKPLDDRQLNGFVQEVTSGLTEMNKKFKLTIKKNYVNEILLHAKGAQNLAQYVVMIVCNENQLAGSAATYLATRRQRTAEKRNNNNSGSEDEEEGDLSSQPRGIGAANHLKSLSMRQQPRKRVINDTGLIDGK